MQPEGRGFKSPSVHHPFLASQYVVFVSKIHDAAAFEPFKVQTHKVYSAKLIQKPLASLSQFKEGVMVPFQKITEAHIVAKFYTSRKRLSDFGCPRVRGLILTADL